MADEAYREVVDLVVMRRGDIVWYVRRDRKLDGFHIRGTDLIGVNLLQGKRPRTVVRNIVDTLVHEFIHWACPECTHKHIRFILRILRRIGDLPR